MTERSKETAGKDQSLKRSLGADIRWTLATTSTGDHPDRYDSLLQHARTSPAVPAYGAGGRPAHHDGDIRLDGGGPWRRVEMEWDPRARSPRLFRVNAGATVQVARRPGPPRRPIPAPSARGPAQGR